MYSASSKGAIIFATGMEEKTVSRQFAPEESGMLLEYVLDSVWTVADELFVVFGDEPKLPIIEAISPFGVKVLSVERGQGPLKAITEAFKLSKSEYCLLVTERVPLLKPNVVLALFEGAQGNDGAIPRWSDGRVEPMLAVYRKNPFIHLINSWKKPFSGNVRKGISTLADQLFDVRFLSIEDEIKELDPELDSFLEVRDDKSLLAARKKASISGKVARLRKTTR